MGARTKCRTRINFNDKTAPYFIAVRLKKGELSVELMREVIAIYEKHAG